MWESWCGVEEGEGEEDVPIRLVDEVLSELKVVCDLLIDKR